MDSAASSFGVQGAFAVGQDVQAARSLVAVVEHEIRDDVAVGKGRFEELPCEEAPVARQGKVCGSSMP